MSETAEIEREMREAANRAHSSGYGYFRAGAILAILSALDEARERAEHAESFCYRAAKAAGQHEFVCAETVSLRAERDRLAAELAKYRCPIGAKNGSPSCSAGTCPECNNMRARGAVDRLATLLREAGEVVEPFANAAKEENIDPNDETFDNKFSHVSKLVLMRVHFRRARALKAKIDAELNSILSNEPNT